MQGSAELGYIKLKGTIVPVNIKTAEKTGSRLYFFTVP